MPDIQQYSVTIKFKTEGSEKASKDMEKVNDSLGKMKGAGSAMAGLGSALGTFGAAATAATVVVGKFVSKGAQALEKWGGKALEMSKKTASYIETVNLFRASMGAAADEATKFYKRAESELGLDSEDVMHSVSAFQNLSEGLGIANDRAYLMSKNLTQLSGDLSSFANISFETAQKKLLSGFSGQVKPLREYGIALDQASLQELAYSLGLDQKVKNMTRAQKTELIYYQIMKSTQKMQGDLGRSILSPANALRVMQTEFNRLSRAVGSIFIPMMMKIIPVVRAVTKELTSAAQAIANFFGFKQENYDADLSTVGNLLEGVGGDIDDVGDSAEDTSKKLNKMLMPFDELNNITSNSGSGGAGAGGVGAGGSLGIDLPQYDMFASLDDSFNNMIAKGNWGEIGKTIGRKINEALAAIPWEDIKKQAGEVGKKIAEFLNGGITSIDWKLVGGTVAQGFNTVFSFTSNFLETFNFTSLGKSVSDTITGFFNDVDWGDVGKTLSESIKGAFDIALGLLVNLDFSKINSSIWTMLKNIDWLQILKKWSQLFLTMFYKTNPIGIIVKYVLKAIGAMINTVIGWINKIQIDVPEKLQEWFGLPEQIGFDIKEVNLDIDSILKKVINTEAEIEESVGNMNDTIENSSDQASNTIEKDFSAASSSVNQNMEQTAQSVAKNFESTKSIFESTYGDMGNSQVLTNLQEKIKGALNQSNNSGEWGAKTIENYAAGLSKETSISKTINGIENKIKSGLDNKNNSYNWGSTTVAQYNSGMLSQEYATNKAVAVFKGKFQSLFPSKDTSYIWGKDMMQGIINGIEASKELVRNAVTKVANVISRVIHFSRPDEGPLRDYETWMPDMVKGLSDTLISSMPLLKNTMLKVSEEIANNLKSVDLQEEYKVNLSRSMQSNVIPDLRNRTSTANKSQSTSTMADATYSAISRALAENKNDTQPQMIQVNIGNKEVYKGYGQYKDEQSNMLGISVG